MKTRANYLKVGIPEVTGFFVVGNETSDANEVLCDNAEALRRIREWQERNDVISHDYDYDFAEHVEAGK